MPEVGMPRLSDSMEEGTILKWLKAHGEEVSRGDELVEIETDKANMTYEADADGVLEIVAAEGDTLPVGEPIARILAPGESPAEDGGGRAEREEPKTNGGAPERAPAEAAPVADRGAEQPTEAPAPAGQAPAPSTGGEAREAPARTDGRVKASPVARRMAREMDIALETLAGSGPGGRIVKADVEAAARGEARTIERPAPAPQPAPAPAEAGAPETARGATEVVELTRTQQLIARRMAESKATVPDFTLRVTLDMGAVLEMRAQIKAAIGEHGTVPSLNDFVVKACGLALREHPRVNGSYRDGRFELHERVNVGVAVAAQDALIVPTVFDADRRSLGAIAAHTRELASKVRNGTVTPPELSGATFTVSNLGMFGIDDFSPIINPPQAAILAVGAVTERPAVRDGEIVARPLCDLSLVCDHRILYGADGAQFLTRVRELLEAPATLAL